MPWFEGAFLAIGATGSIAFAALTPPFHSFDEPHHFLRAFQLSEGGVIGELILEDGRPHAGGVLPRGIWPAIREAHSRCEGSPAIALDSSGREFRTFENTVLYSPVGYLPQVAAVGVARHVTWRVPPMLYAARVAGAFAFVALCWLALRTTPVCKPAFFALPLLPAPLFLAGSVSADPITLGSALLFAAIVFRIAFGDWELRGRPAYALLGTAVALALSKQGYLPLLGLMLLVPRSRARWTWIGGIASAALVSQALWSWLVSDVYVPYNPRVPAELIVPGEQAAHVLAHPFQFASLIAGDLLQSGKRLVGNAIGLPFVPSLSRWQIRLAGATALFALTAASDIRPSWQQRLWTLTLAAALTVFLYVLVYLSWQPVGSNEIEGMQGRYLLPIAPALFVALAGLFPGLERGRALAILAATLALQGALAVHSLSSHYRIRDPAPSTCATTVRDPAGTQHGSLSRGFWWYNESSRGESPATATCACDPWLPGGVRDVAATRATRHARRHRDERRRLDSRRRGAADRRRARRGRAGRDATALEGGRNDRLRARTRPAAPP